MGVVVIKCRSESQLTVLLGYLTITTNVRCYYLVVYNIFCLSARQCTGAYNVLMCR